ncbi:MAG: DNA polymerase III subunit alpha, partial [Gemmatimonadales bacterium]
MAFVHLHTHSEYSLLDGANRIPELVAHVRKLGMDSLAVTDHGNLHAAWSFYEEAKAHGIRPILGFEAYLAFGPRREPQTPQWAPSNYSHLVLLAKNRVGYRNLVRLTSIGFTEGFYRRPRVDRESLERHSEGIVCLAACLSGEVALWLRQQNWDRARETAKYFARLFGPDGFWLEIQQHGIAEEKIVMEGMLRLGRELGIGVVATNDAHYLRREDAEAHDVLLAIGTGADLDDPQRFRFTGQESYVKSEAEMRTVFREHPETLDNTARVADLCEFSFEKKYYLPGFPRPAEYASDEALLEALSQAGAERRYGAPLPVPVAERLAYELGVINRAGYAGYFLIVQDFIAAARERGIPVGPGRGSAAGSLVAYALGITTVDPLRFDLLFERFLNPERVSMPDIDMDFDERRRADMIRYATEKYGEERVAQIITYGTIKAKAAIKDAARVLGYPFAMGERITKAMPPAVMGKDIPLAGIFDPSHPRYSEAGEFRQLYETDADVRKVVDTARGLEGLKRQWGVHAAGVILSSEPLVDVIPIQRREQDGAVITQFDMGACENLGLLKMDFLGLRNLTVLDDCLVNIEANRGQQLELETIGLDDKNAYELLARGDTLGVFQLDGGPMRALLRSMQPDSFEDISAVLALYRPGPMGANAHNDYADRKNGRKPVLPIHRELAGPLAEILGDTYGLIVYQEQVMAIAQQLAGYSLGAADLLRRAMGKKKKEILDKEYVPFSEGMRQNGYSDGAIKKLWDILVPFSDYAFNKAHTAGYGLVSYWTAYLKANYPAEYMAGLLTSVRDDKDKSALYLNECRRMGIRVLPPDVNESAADFTPTGVDIRFGLAAVRNVGANVVAAIAEARRAKGRFTDFKDFLRKVPPAVCNKKTIESLVKSGAFDSLGHARRGLLQIHERAIDAIIDIKRNEAIGQDSLFGGWSDGTDAVEDVAFDIPVPEGEWDKQTLLSYEREMLGLYVSDHPLLGIEHVLAAAADCSVAALTAGDDRADGSVVTVA